MLVNKRKLLLNQRLFSSLASQSSLWADMTPAPIDFNFHLKEEMKSDPNEMKVNLGVGAYRDENGKPWILPSVKKA